MDLESVSTILRETIWLALSLAAPVLITALASGLVISVFQAATQVNEQTLTFVPKIVLVLTVFALTFPRMMTLLGEFMRRLLLDTASRGGP